MSNYTQDKIVNCFLVLILVSFFYGLYCVATTAPSQPKTIHSMPEIEIVKWIKTADLPSGIYSFQTGTGFIYFGKNVQIVYDPFPKGYSEVK